MKEFSFLSSLISFCRNAVTVSLCAGLSVTWTPPPRAGSLLLICSLSLRNQSPVSPSPAQVLNAIAQNATNKHRHMWRASDVVFVCNRGQRLGEPQHIIQLQRDLHQLLRRQTSGSAVKPPSPAPASRYLCCIAKISTWIKVCTDYLQISFIFPDHTLI